MTVAQLQQEMSGTELLEWSAYLTIESEIQKDADPENMSTAERQAYLKGAAAAR